MFKRLQSRGKFIGYILEDPSVLYFFGSRHLAREDLYVQFPQFEFAFLKQVHGCSIVEADPETALAADGHFTSKPGLALVSQTADCIPILLSGPGFVCAIHAGWRGVALNIIAAARSRLRATPESVAIGPHIRRRSFEIGMDVAEKLLNSCPPDHSQSAFIYPTDQPDKIFFDLNELVRVQLQYNFTATQPWDTGDDTKSSPEFHSFRRDRERAGRQYSFVVLKS
jgi:YfiH family protein